MKSFILALALAALPALTDFDSAVLVLSGASTLEELSESALEHYRALALRPVDLNLAGRSRLTATGLFSPFQIASLLDYRERSGDILSYAELALIDGFSPDVAEALKSFTVLRSDAPPGARRRTQLQHDLMLRASAKMHDGPAAAGGLKYKATLGERAEFNWSTRTTYSDASLYPGTLSAAYYGRRWLGKVVLGHFNARFGQGAALWSGFSMSHYSSVAAFRRNGSGFTPTGSFSPGHCGIAADADFGRWNVAAAYSVSERQAMGIVSWCGRRMSLAVAGGNFGASAEVRLGLKNLGVFGEFAWTGQPAAVLGAIWVPRYQQKYAVRLSYTGGVPEVSAGAGTKCLDAVAALSPGEFRAMAKYAPQFSLGPVSLKPALRVAARSKSSWRLEGRGELRAAWGAWEWNSRLDVVHCKALSWLLNTEAGYNSGALKIWLRGTLFCIDNWDDRIYVYERDAPGNFNVPAYYGRGWNVSVYGGWKISRRHSLYLRLSYLEYPWMTAPKPSKAEAKLQYSLSL